MRKVKLQICQSCPQTHDHRKGKTTRFTQHLKASQQIFLAPLKSTVSFFNQLRQVHTSDFVCVALSYTHKWYPSGEAHTLLRWHQANDFQKAGCE